MPFYTSSKKRAELAAAQKAEKANEETLTSLQHYLNFLEYMAYELTGSRSYPVTVTLTDKQIAGCRAELNSSSTLPSLLSQEYASDEIRLFRALDYDVHDLANFMVYVKGNNEKVRVKEPTADERKQGAKDHKYVEWIRAWHRRMEEVVSNYRADHGL